MVAGEDGLAVNRNPCGGKRRRSCSGDHRNAPLHAPGGTKGTEPVAMMMSLAVTSPPMSTRPALPYLTVCGPANLALPIRMS